MTLSQKGQISAVQRLLENGTRIDEKDSNGNTALFYSIESQEENKLDVISLLLKHKANINHANSKKVC